ncbi:hypothetical protein ABT352_23270 [Streptosporangium sp. NPDC000563]|uniref:hypothetical protein n=1 Tax=Streptosporangium sp. NPDC000563 TaxID=3154366 RepID=UPI003332C97D
MRLPATCWAALAVAGVLGVAVLALLLPRRRNPSGARTPGRRRTPAGGRLPAYALPEDTYLISTPGLPENTEPPPVLFLPSPATAQGCCPEVYFCPTSGDVECPRHGGFDVCCAWPGAHRPVTAP